MSTTTTPEQGTGTWNIDSTHSSLDFSVRHMGIFTVKGSLGTVTGTVKTVDGVLTELDLSIDANGISTGNADRDAHLKNADFLDVAQYPTITFTSTGIEKKGENDYAVTGDLSMHGETHPATLEAEVVPPIKDPYGLTRAGATGSGVISRKLWGLTYNSVMETGNVMVSDEVKFTFDVQGVLV